jgi:hypothetical protein
MRFIGAGSVALVALSCGACSSYLDRRDTLTPASGDAVRANIAIHVIDPWPVQASRIDRQGNGERAQRAVERYRNPQTGAAALGSPSPAAQQGTPAPSPSGGLR